MFVLAIVWVLVGEYIWRVMKGRQIIRDANHEAYLIRYFIWKPDWLRYIGINPKKAGRIYLHNILRSDHDRANHSHPWAFVSLILKGGYIEYSTGADVYHNASHCWPRKVKWDFANWPLDRSTVRSEFKAPALIRRPAVWRHRLELPKGKTAWTLVFIGPKTNEWGFFPGGKFCHWKKYDTGTGLCEED